VGLEWSIYDIPLATSVNYQGPPGGEPFTPYAITEEQGYGLHVGYVLENTFYFGIVALISRGRWMESPNYEVNKEWFNLGPDIRVKTSAPSHIYLNGAYTVRRGFKFGLGYLF
jgi:hypothetical protein